MKLTRADKHWIHAFRQELSQRFPGMVSGVLIYGSKARGEATSDSDLDVLLILEDRAVGCKREMRAVGYSLDPYGEVVPSLIAYTRTEWQKLKTSGSPFRRAVERDAVHVR